MHKQRLPEDVHVGHGHVPYKVHSPVRSWLRSQHVNKLPVMSKSVCSQDTEHVISCLVFFFKWFLSLKRMWSLGDVSPSPLAFVHRVTTSWPRLLDYHGWIRVVLTSTLQLTTAHCTSKQAITVLTVVTSIRHWKPIRILDTHGFIQQAEASTAVLRPEFDEDLPAEVLPSLATERAEGHRRGGCATTTTPPARPGPSNRPASEGSSVSAEGTRGCSRQQRAEMQKDAEALRFVQLPATASPSLCGSVALVGLLFGLLQNSHARQVTSLPFEVAFSALSTPALCTNRRGQSPDEPFWLSASTEFGWGWAPGGSAGARFTPQAANWPS